MAAVPCVALPQALLYAKTHHAVPKLSPFIFSFHVFPLLLFLLLHHHPPSTLSPQAACNSPWRADNHTLSSSLIPPLPPSLSASLLSSPGSPSSHRYSSLVPPPLTPLPLIPRVAPGCVAFLLHGRHQGRPGCYVAALWEPPASPQACIHAWPPQLQACEPPVCWFCFTNQLVCSSSLFSLLFSSSGFLLSRFCGRVFSSSVPFFYHSPPPGFVYSACSVFGVVMQLMRTRFPLLPGSLTWRRCTPAARQSRYNCGGCCLCVVFVTPQSAFSRISHIWSSSFKK